MAKSIDGFIDTRQAAEVLGVSVHEVYRLVRLRVLRHHRFGANNGLIRFLKADLQAYIDGCAIEPVATRKRGGGTTKLRHLKG